MSKFTILLQTYHHVEADDMLEAAQDVRAQLPEGAGIQNIQVIPGHQQFSNDH